MLRAISARGCVIDSLQHKYIYKFIYLFFSDVANTNEKHIFQMQVLHIPINQKTQNTFLFTCFSKQNGTTWHDYIHLCWYMLAMIMRMLCKKRFADCNSQALPLSYYHFQIRATKHTSEACRNQSFILHQSTSLFSSRGTKQLKPRIKINQCRTRTTRKSHRNTQNIKESKPFEIHVCSLPRYCSAHIAKVFMHRVLGKGKAVHAGNPSEQQCLKHRLHALAC